MFTATFRPALVLFLLLLPSTVPAAEPLRLGLPLDCEPGSSCWIVRYFDHGPGAAVRDYACGALTGDEHKGTDFAISDLGALARGVAVRAAAAGEVVGWRDGVPDVIFDPANAPGLAGEECGNGVRLRHGDGWETQYCHLQQGSLSVRRGDRVAAGEALGRIGLSGETNFPHVHFTVRHDGRALDPFVGLAEAGAEAGNCEAPRAPLWQEDLLAGLDYAPVLITGLGVAPREPDKAAIREGRYRRATLPSNSALLALWCEGYWFDQGDQVQLRLTGPQGELVIDRRFQLGRDRQRWSTFASAPRPAEGWPRGRYQAELVVERPGDAKLRLVRTTALEIY